MMRVAFQGTEGAFSEEALLKTFPEAIPVGFPTFHQVFSAVTTGEAEYGVVPVENTTAGIINQTYDLLLETDLHVIGEIVLKVEHCLLLRARHSSPSARSRATPRVWPSATGSLPATSSRGSRSTILPGQPAN